VDAHPSCFLDRAFRGAFSALFATVSPVIVTVTTALVSWIAIVAHNDPGTLVTQMKFHILSGR
jgi:hypothetical protein